MFDVPPWHMLQSYGVSFTFAKLHCQGSGITLIKLAAGTKASGLPLGIALAGKAQVDKLL